jgi:hypothetical protein
MSHTHHIFGCAGCHVLRDGKDQSDATQTTENQQVGGQTGADTGTAIIAGAGASPKTSSGGSTTIGGAIQGKNTINITSSDPDVTEAALAAGVSDSQAASADTATVAQTALDDSSLEAIALSQGADTVAAGAIGSGESDVANSESFADDALQAAANENADNTTETEALAAEYATGLSQSAANAQILANDAYTGQGQALNSGNLPTLAAEAGTTSWQTLATWVAIISGIIAIYYYFKKGKV